jgi:diguanylate cyclase (GGDEF)-like protein
VTVRFALEDPSKLRRVLEATRLVEGSFVLRDLLHHVIAEACSMTDARYGALGVLNGSRDGLAEFITVGLTRAEEDGIGPCPAGNGLLGLLIDEPTPAMVGHLAVHAASSGFPPGHPPMTSFLGVPLKVADDVYGNLYLTDKRGGGPFTADDRDLLEALALAAGIGIENARLHEALRLVTELQSDSRRDHLTGLPNRRAWDERLDEELERCRRSGSLLTVALLDLDGFKAVNDSRGHSRGDLVLRQFAESWKRILRSGSDFVARLGGDEFGLLAPDLPSAGVRSLADRHASAEPFGIGYSLGTATWDGIETAGQLVHRADLSMYQAKALARAVLPAPCAPGSSISPLSPLSPVTRPAITRGGRRKVAAAAGRPGRVRRIRPPTGRTGRVDQPEAAIPYTGRARNRPPIEPSKGAPPNANTPPSWAAVQYPDPVGSAAIPIMGALSTWSPIEPPNRASPNEKTPPSKDTSQYP